MNIEEFLIKNKYWIWSAGSGSDPPMLNITAKWRAMMKALFVAYPNQMITEKMIWDYIQDLL